MRRPSGSHRATAATARRTRRRTRTRARSLIFLITAIVLLYFLPAGNEILYGGASWKETTNWWGSTNLRLGVPFLANQALVYALGGVAYGNRKIDAAGFVGPFSTQGSFGGTSVGWDVGGGLAAKIGSSGEVFVARRWVDLGSVSGQLSLTIPGVESVAGASQNFGFAIGEVGYAYQSRQIAEKRRALAARRALFTLGSSHKLKS